MACISVAFFLSPWSFASFTSLFKNSLLYLPARGRKRSNSAAHFCFSAIADSNVELRGAIMSNFLAFFLLRLDLLHDLGEILLPLTRDLVYSSILVPKESMVLHPYLSSDSSFQHVSLILF